MNEVSKVIATGNLALRVKIKAADELKELADNFNTIINNLASGMQNMANSLRDEKRKEKELAQSYRDLDQAKAKDEALLISIGDAVVAIGINQKIMLFNEAASKMTGIGTKDAIGQPHNLILKFQDEVSHHPAADFINTALKGEKVRGSRIMLQKANGEMLPILHTTSPIFDSQGQVTGVVVVLNDVTRERELEKLKDEFVSLASHELRTPMTAIKGLVSMIMEGDYGNVSEELKDPLSDIAQSTQRLINLVNDMLDVSRIEAGRTKFTFTEVSIPDLVAETVKTLKPIAVQKNIGLEETGSPIYKVRADSDKVKQILINLANNALKFTDHGRVVISYRSWGRYVYISVADSGIGISKENQEKLFGKFSQVNSSQNGRPLGSGLGLYLSREFARKMGGEMWIERSEKDKGSTFTFALPFASSVL
ncbi:PAS domain S-box protein [Candidatus Daviesbacteria bacterium]|nr:PAS domain S-box protein [Candidatus Daviesbacteria bacterium]